MQRFVTIAIIVGALGLSILFALDTHLIWAVLMVVVGLFWLSEPWHGFAWAPTTALLFFTGAGSVGLVLSLPAFWLVTCLVALLVAWDLNNFSDYLDDVEDIRHRGELTKRHFRRLGIVAGAGWLLGVLALGIKLTFGFLWALGSGLLVIVSLSRAISRIGRASDQS
jgi:hypothetical protein